MHVRPQVIIDRYAMGRFICVQCSAECRVLVNGMCVHCSEDDLITKACIHLSL